MVQHEGWCGMCLQKKSERGPLEGINLGLSKVKNLNFRGYVKFCTRHMICQKKSNLSICWQVLDLSICRSVDSSEKIDRSTDNIQQIWLSGTQNLICWSVDMSTDCWSVDLSTVPTDEKNWKNRHIDRQTSTNRENLGHSNLDTLHQQQGSAFSCCVSIFNLSAELLGLGLSLVSWVLARWGFSRELPCKMRILTKSHEISLMRSCYY